MRTMFLLIAVALLGAQFSGVFDARAEEEAMQHNFVGADGCKLCHKSAKSGNQYGIWLEGPHAQAYEVLGSDAAKAIAAEKGLEGSPQELDECLRCHVTAHGVDPARLEKKYRPTDGVGCESCHGPGDGYKGKSTMESRELSVAAGLIIPTAETCTTCHNEESPTFKGFDFDEYFAKIAHPTPAKEE